MILNIDGKTKAVAESSTFYGVLGIGVVFGNHFCTAIQELKHVTGLVKVFSFLELFYIDHVSTHLFKFHVIEMWPQQSF
jgi:hypothetical protein